MEKRKKTEKKIKVERLVLVIVLILGALFYWFSVRPAQIKKECADLVYGYKSCENNEQFENFEECKKSLSFLHTMNDITKKSDVYYEQCLRKHGL